MHTTLQDLSKVGTVKNFTNYFSGEQYGVSKNLEIQIMNLPNDFRICFGIPSQDYNAPPPTLSFIGIGIGR